MRLDAPYKETDPIHPHVGHIMQPFDEAASLCVNCGEFNNWLFDNGFSKIVWTDDGLEVS